jgi:hypothetical protein
VELDTIKTLYQRTEELSQRTLEQAERRGEETLGNANRVVDRVQQRVDSAMALLTKRIAPVLSILTVALGGLGIHSYLDVRDKYREAVGWHDSLGKFQERVRSADKSLRVISETMTDLRSAREAASLHAPLETPAELRRAALEFERAKSELYEKYIASPSEGARYEQFDPEVVFEAASTIVDLASWGRVDGRPALSRSERAELLAALSFVVRTLSDEREATSGGPLLDRKLRDVYYQLAEPTDGADRRQLVVALGRVLERPASGRARDNAALILASLSEKTPAVRDALASMMIDVQPWRAASGAIALAKLRDVAAWKRVKRALDEPAMRYAFTAVLAQDGSGTAALRGLAGHFGDAARVPDLMKSMRAAVAGHVPRNCYEQRYDQWLTTCLEGACRSGQTPIGGECKLRGS